MRIVFFFLVFALACHAQTNPAVNVHAWGNNSSGQCNVPPDLTNAVAIAAGYQHSLALRSNGRVVAWGRNDFGMCNVPPDLTNAVAIGGGIEHSMALRDDGKVVAWGWDAYGQCDVPNDLTNVVAISAGGDHSLALRGDGKVVAWGRNDQGQCNVPPDLTNAVAIAGLKSTSLAVRADGTVAAWGDNLCLQTNVPAGISNVATLAPCPATCWSLGLTRSGTAFSWNADPHVPTDWTNIVAIGLGQGFGFGVRDNGTISAWGESGGSFDAALAVPTNLPATTAVSGGLVHALSLHTGPLPTLFSGPVDRNVPAGSTVRFSCRVIGVPPLSYQWYFGTNALSFGTNSVLSLSDVQPAQSGAYYVVITNAFGSTTSSPANLNVFVALDINIVPAISLQGAEGLTYRLDYINEVGPTNAWVPLTTVTISNSGQFYFDVSAIGQTRRFYRLVQVP